MEAERRHDDGAGPQQHLGAELFDAFARRQDGTVTVGDIEAQLVSLGLGTDDPRLVDFYQTLRMGGLQTDQETFSKAYAASPSLINKALKGELIIPDFSEFSRTIFGIYAAAKQNDQGKVADYIPQLKRVPAEKFSVAVCTVDGQRFSVGDSKEFFSLQSCTKPISYLLALKDHGADKVHEHVGREPSGQSFNEITLDGLGRPHNPMINAGAIMTSALIQRSLKPAERFDYVLESWKRAAGGVKPNFNNAVYLSERDTADRNFALAYFMRENGAFPEDTNIVDTLEFYFQCCAMELSCDAFAVIGATLARSGQCPLTGERLFEASHVKHSLSLMNTCGMYDFSGEFAFTIGLPAKSGVGGGLLLVVPNVMGICIWSPPLDKNGNSVRGIEFSKRLVETYNFHNFDDLTADHSDKSDPRLKKNQRMFDTTMALCWAAAHGDVDELQKLCASGVDLNEGDYDGRTALHLAASENQVEVIRYLLAHGVQHDPKDRWGGTPLDDARREGHREAEELLKGGTPVAAE